MPLFVSHGVLTLGETWNLKLDWPAVALRLLAPEATQNDTARRRLLKEAQSASSLNHPNIVTIHAIEEAEGQDFIVMGNFAQKVGQLRNPS
jgi:serine/threonine protein kinase